jgi:hypothetical protein
MVVVMSVLSVCGGHCRDLIGVSTVVVRVTLSGHNWMQTRVFLSKAVDRSLCLCIGSCSARTLSI